MLNNTKQWPYETSRIKSEPTNDHSVRRTNNNGNSSKHRNGARFPVPETAWSTTMENFMDNQSSSSQMWIIFNFHIPEQEHPSPLHPICAFNPYRKSHLSLTTNKQEK
ncbi:hypothetical protein K0M31_003006 [Melipona bicolor]|uniref:Uncharacterized protein n=1 Tax=Melipona bicolor TaxID=60889 RepID=A0AA40KQ20_9HYME|nr:hypothetical protein K0M31_003006 [Melipona bicolor]